MVKQTFIDHVNGVYLDLLSCIGFSCLSQRGSLSSWSSLELHHGVPKWAVQGAGLRGAEQESRSPPHPVAPNPGLLLATLLPQQGLVCLLTKSWAEVRVLLFCWGWGCLVGW